MNSIFEKESRDELKARIDIHADHHLLQINC
jgi:hypothetical protein